jgi:hypothetical protein
MREASAVCRGWRGRCVALAVAAALVQPGSRCGAPEVKATLLRFPATDGVVLDGVLVGSGPAGVVLLHQYPADLCGASGPMPST